MWYKISAAFALIFSCILFAGHVTFAQTPTDCPLKNQGDANCDGNVTLQDYENWRKEFLAETTTKTADFNNDVIIGLVDYEIWRRNVDRSFPQLISNFFKNDFTAQSIVSGTNYPMQESNFILPDVRVNSSSFEYKFINGLRQIGYNQLTHFTKTTGDGTVTTSLHLFQTRHNFPQTDFVDKQVLLLLDQELARREEVDRLQANAYAPYFAFIDPPALNEPAKEHLAAMYATFFSALPPILITNTPGEGVVLTVDQFRISLGAFRYRWLGKMLNPQTLTVFTDSQMYEVIRTKSDFRFCALYYYNIYHGADCTSPRNNPSFIFEDLAYIAFQSHEYGHGIGVNPTRATDPYDFLFGQISFNVPGDSTMIRPSNANNEFMSLYAQTNYHEDFAESFAAYILMGNIFRERAKADMYLQQKYQFLKNTIFQGTEYDTGAVNSLNKWNTTNTTLPYNFQLFLQNDPDWVWDYQYKIL